MRQPHQTSDMLTNFKMIFFAYLKTLMTLIASKCKNNYGAAAKICKVMKIMCRMGKKVKTEKMSFVSLLNIQLSVELFSNCIKMCF